MPAELDGHDYRARPLEDRTGTLERLVRNGHPGIGYCPCFFPAGQTERPRIHRMIALISEIGISTLSWIEQAVMAHPVGESESWSQIGTKTILSSHKTSDLGEILRHRIAGDLDAGGIEPGMGVERLVGALGGPEMHHARHAAAAEHDLRGHGLRQAYRLERDVARGARHRPADLGGKRRLMRRGCHSSLRNAGIRGRHKRAKPRREPRKRNEDQREPRNEQARYRLNQQRAAAVAEFAEPDQEAAYQTGAPRQFQLTVSVNRRGQALCLPGAGDHKGRPYAAGTGSSAIAPCFTSSLRKVSTSARQTSGATSNSPTNCAHSVSTSCGVSINFQMCAPTSERPM